MADGLATINIEQLNQAVSTAVNLSRLADLSSSVSKLNTASKTSSTASASTTLTTTSATKAGKPNSSPRASEHVFVKPLHVPKKKADAVVTTGVGSGAVSQVVTASKPEKSSLSRVPLAPRTPVTSQPRTVLPLILSTPNVQVSTKGSIQTTSQLPPGTVVYTLPQIISSPVSATTPVAAQPTSTTVALPVSTAKTSPSTTSSFPTQPPEGLNLEVQLPVVQSLPPGAQIVNSFSTQPQNVKSLGHIDVAVNGKMLKLLPMPAGVKTQTPPLGQPVTLVQSQGQTSPREQSDKVTTSAKSPVTQTVTLVTSGGTSSLCPIVTSSVSDMPDLLAAATQAAVPHLITQYPKPQQPQTLQINKNHEPSQPKIIRLSAESSNISVGGQPRILIVNAPNIAGAVTAVEASSQSKLVGSTNTGTVQTAVPVIMDAKTAGGETQTLLSSTGTISQVLSPPNLNIKQQAKDKTVFTLLLNEENGGVQRTSQSVVELEGAGNSEGLNFKGQFCYECNRVNAEECTVHTTPPTHVPDAPILTRARASIPTALRLNTQGGGSVEAVKKVPARTKFGPLVGVPQAESSDSGQVQAPYTWKVFNAEYPILDCSDEEQSNWMRFVWPASTTAEQNLTAYQEGDSIYFISTTDIGPDTELRYWYSEDYAKALGKPPRPGQWFTCWVCSKLYDSLHAIQQHVRYAHADTTKRRFKCSLCTRAFSTSSKFNTHLLGHMGHKPHKCDFCSKSFSDQSNLRTHLLIHSDVRQFVCCVCQRSFKQKAHLSSHMLTHTGEKKMACHYCPKRFARRSDLRQHELQHTKEQTYYCPHEDCQKVFYKPQSLRKHLKIHDGIRAYTCVTCEKSFATAYHLKRHINTQKQQCGKAAEN